MKVLVINSGSSSLKYQLIESKGGAVICKGVFERIGENNPVFSHNNSTQRIFDEPFACKTHAEAVAKMFSLLTDAKVGGVKNLSDIDAIGHRTVHGGETFKQSTLVTPETLKEVEKLVPLAPLHNPANITGIKECIKALPKTPNVMVFDTAFHSTMPKKAFLYAIPLENYTKHQIRRYGFHGTSHNFVAREAAKMAGKPIKDLKIITCHIGNGCSVTAVNGGVSVENSLGMTPLEGLVMGTRSGDLDPAVVEVLCKIHNFSVADCINYLNKKSGLRGLSGGLTDGDFRELRDKRTTHQDAQNAIDCFVHRLVKYIGAYTAVMNGADIIVWTGGVGNNIPYVREQVMKNFEYLGANIDRTKNEQLDGTDGKRNLTLDISAKDAKVKTFVICTNEELEIATETEKTILKK